LKTRDHGHVAIAESLTDTVGSYFQNLRAGVLIVSNDAGLRTGKRRGFDALGRECHAHQRHGNALTGGQQHVNFAWWSIRAHIIGQTKEIVGEFAHRRDNHHDVVTRAAGPRDVIGDGAYAFGIADRRSTELLNDYTHPYKLVATLFSHFGAPLGCTYAYRKKSSPEGRTP
jgi:hypothetical protein